MNPEGETAPQESERAVQVADDIYRGVERLIDSQETRFYLVFPAINVNDRGFRRTMKMGHYAIILKGTERG